MMEYKGYIGKVELDDEAKIFHGEIINTRDVITFQGKSVAELTKAFRESIDDYLAFCEKRGETPDKPFSGQFVTRISPELHRQINVAAVLAGKSLNAFVAEQLQVAVQKIGVGKAGSKKVASKGKKTGATKAARRPKKGIGHRA
ncbi:MAG: type II toxin-antitoxin system HicB family antitoxin [Planctomycetales bacterium]|nr:type II toxin-antitoxin system HicB family antitoxin [Planctomycetales bacterium]